MSGEPPAKRRKLKSRDAPPNVTVEVAEPTPKEEDVPGTRQRQCALNTDELPYEFLTPEKRRSIEEHEARLAEKEEKNSKKAKALLGIFIGAGFGMWIAYMVKGKLFSPAAEAVLENAAKIVDE